MSFFVATLRKAVGRGKTNDTVVDTAPGENGEKKLEEQQKTEVISVSPRTRRGLFSRRNLPKKSLKEYELEKKLGEGTFAVVMSAKCKQTGGKVAVKALKNEPDLDFLRPGKHRSEGVTYGDVVDIFLGEIKCMESLGAHPNIVAAYSKGQHYIVMECAKVDLYNVRLAAGTALPLASARSLLSARALVFSSPKLTSCWCYQNLAQADPRGALVHSQEGVGAPGLEVREHSDLRGPHGKNLRLWTRAQGRERRQADGGRSRAGHAVVSRAGVVDGSQDIHQRD